MIYLSISIYHLGAPLCIICSCIEKKDDPCPYHHRWKTKVNMAWPSVKWAKSGLQEFKRAPRYQTHHWVFWTRWGFVNVGNPNGLWIVFTYYLNLDIQLNGGLFIMIHGRSYEPGWCAGRFRNLPMYTSIGRQFMYWTCKLYICCYTNCWSVVSTPMKNISQLG